MSGYLVHDVVAVASVAIVKYETNSLPYANLASTSSVGDPLTDPSVTKFPARVSLAVHKTFFGSQKSVVSGVERVLHGDPLCSDDWSAL